MQHAGYLLDAVVLLLEASDPRSTFGM